MARFYISRFHETEQESHSHCNLHSLLFQTKFVKLLIDIPLNVHRLLLFYFEAEVKVIPPAGTSLWRFNSQISKFKLRKMTPRAGEPAEERE